MSVAHDVPVPEAGYGWDGHGSWAKRFVILSGERAKVEVHAVDWRWGDPRPDLGEAADLFVVAVFYNGRDSGDAIRLTRHIRALPAEAFAAIDAMMAEVRSFHEVEEASYGRS